MNKQRKTAKMKVVVVDYQLHKLLHIKAREEGIPAKKLANKILKQALNN